ncbi:helix-turn-helix domain-containing protein [Nocardia aurea]|uniref:helix-turn-helix domain-containing protein n=1 Tax=Nocardia aurea TaxID=2144174 RepID=UPI0033BB3762
MDGSIADYLRERREAAGLTRANLSRRAGLSVGLIQKIEQGSRPATLDALAPLFEVLEVPPPMRDHIIGLSLPPRMNSSLSSDADAVNPADLAVLNGFTYPACFQSQPTFDMLAVNQAWTRWFPGLEPGVNIIEWSMLDPTARRILPQWRRQTHLLVYVLRMMGPGLVPDERIEQIARACAAAPEWEELWSTEVAPQDIPRPTILINDPDTGRIREMYTSSLKFDFPRRHWWMYTLAPADHESA